MYMTLKGPQAIVNTERRLINLRDEEELSNAGVTMMYATINDLLWAPLLRTVTVASALQVFASSFQPPTPIELDDEDGEGEGVVPAPSNPRPDTEHPRPSRTTSFTSISSATNLMSNVAIMDLLHMNQRWTNFIAGNHMYQSTMILPQSLSTTTFARYYTYMSIWIPIVPISPSSAQHSFGAAGGPSNLLGELWHPLRGLPRRQGDSEVGGNGSQGRRALSTSSSSSLFV